MADFATRLRTLRKGRNLRQMDLAAALGVAQTTIANYEQHSRFPDEDTLRKIANYFDVSLDYLLGRSDIELLPQHIVEFRLHQAPGPEALTPAAREYLQKMLYGNKEEAFESVLARIRDGMGVKEVYRTVLEPTLKEVGRMWETNEIDVSQEHHFSSATETLMGQLYPFLNAGPKDKGTVILVAVGGELHEIGIRMVSDFLESAGFRSIFLGVNTPTSNIVKAIHDRGADVLAVSATLTFNADAVANMIRHVRSEMKRAGNSNLEIITGGQAFNLDEALWKRVDADGYAANADEAVELVSRLVSNARTGG